MLKPIYPQSLVLGRELGGYLLLNRLRGLSYFGTLLRERAFASGQLNLLLRKFVLIPCLNLPYEWSGQRFSELVVTYACLNALGVAEKIIGIQA